MSHHFESPASREDGRVDITDMFVFPGERSNTTTLVMNVNPDAGLSSPTTFRPDALYEFKVDSDGDAVENLGFRLRFGELSSDGSQTIELFRTRCDVGQEAQTEESLGSGRTNQTIEIANGGRLWAGLAGDPFFADAHALDVFQNALFKENRLDLSAFGQRTFVFGEGRNVTSIVVELPNSEFPAEQIGVWATTYIWKDGAKIQINRYGKPLIHVVFLRVDDHRVEDYNRSQPQDDRRLHATYIADVVKRVTELGGTASNPTGYGEDVAQRLLPDVMPYRINTPANYSLANFNGRTFLEDTFDLMMSLVTNTSISDNVVSSHRYRTSFPYVPPLYTAAEQRGATPYLVHTSN